MVDIVTARTLRATLAALALVLAPAAFANHSFNVNPQTVTISGGQVTFVGGPTQAGALNLSFTGMVCDAGNTIVFVGNSHTFTTVGESFKFVVPVPPGTFQPFQNVLIATSETSTASCNNGGEGFELVMPLVVNIPVPTLHEYALMLVALMLAMLGMRRLRRS